MAKVLEVKICKKDYEDYCEKNGLDPKHKLSRLRYIQTLDEIEDDVKKVIQDVLDGKVSEDALEETTPDFAKAIDYLYKFFACMAGEEDKENPLDKLSVKDKNVILDGIMLVNHEELGRVMEMMFDGIHYFEKMNKLRSKEKEEKKDDKEA